ncbi:MAG: hypothetical protein NVSMB18_15970 [Acetobacteraceae bacterium]
MRNTMWLALADALRQRQRMTDPQATSPIEAQILALTAARGSQKSICPSEVARALDSDWQRLMTPVRQAAARLAQAGRIEILRHGRPVDPAAFKGVIRLRAKDPV